MKLIVSSTTPDVFVDKYLFLDNDFLSIIFKDSEVFEKFLDLSRGGSPIIDPLTRIEFLQSTYLPSQRDLKEQFIGNDEFFISAVDHPEIFKKVRENALTLSYLYAHNKTLGASTVDLLLAGRALIYKKSLIISGNRKDFPSTVFDVVGVFNYEEGNQIRAYSVLAFNKSKFSASLDKWKAL